MKFASILCLALVVLAAQAEKKSYKDYHIYHVTVESEAQGKAIVQFPTYGVTLMNGDTIRIGKGIDVLAPPHLAKDFGEQLKQNGYKFVLTTSNLQDWIDEEQETLARLREDKQASWYESYHSYEEIYAKVDELAAANDDLSTINIGQTHDGNDQIVVALCKGGCGNKPAMYIEGSIHAREWIAAAVTMYMLGQVTENLDPANNDLVENLDWYFLPVTNVDGYKYSWESDRLWRKTRSENPGYDCKGTDPNRNWGFQWNTGGTSDYPCDETYHGATAWSEACVDNVRKFTEERKDQIAFAHDIHSYSQLILEPYGYTTNEPSGPVVDAYQAAYRAGNEALKASHGMDYEQGPIATTIYVASGSSVDYWYGELNIPYTVSMELRPSSALGGGFQLPADEIVPNGEEVWAFHEVVARAVIDNPNPGGK